MNYKKLVEKLKEHQEAVTEQIDAIHEGADLKDVVEKLLVTLARTDAIVKKFLTDEEVGE